MTTEHQYFLDRISTLDSAANGASADGWHRQDEVDVVVEVAEYLGRALDVPTLDRELVSRSQLDVSKLRDVKSWFQSIADTDLAAFQLTFLDGAKFDAPGRLKRLDDLLGSLGDAETLEEIEVGLRLNMVGDPAFERMLMALPADHEVRAKVAMELRAKLALVSDEVAFQYWAALRAQVDPSRVYHLKPDPDVAPLTFFDIGAPDEVRGRIADYLARVRPLLIRKSIESGQPSVPAGEAGIASVLSWTDTPATSAWSTTDRAMIRSLSRIALLFPKQAELARALGVRVGGYFIGGRGESEAKRAFDPREKAIPAREWMLPELVKLLRIADLKSRIRRAPLERALRAYKLGLEVMAQDVTDAMKKRDELRLQREVCRFLVEREVLAYGTKFGWAETDIRGHDEYGTALIEAKIVRTAPTKATINKWLTQLVTYMDQDQGPKASRGVLVLFNFSPSSLIAPPSPLRGVYDIVAINLCPTSPSKRKASIEIVPARSGDDIVDVLKLGVPPSPRKLAAKNKKVGAKKQAPVKP